MVVAIKIRVLIVVVLLGDARLCGRVVVLLVII